MESPEQMDAFLKQEENMLKDMVEKVAKTGANVLICQKGIDDLAQHFLARKGILAASARTKIRKPRQNIKVRISKEAAVNNQYDRDQ